MKSWTERVRTFLRLPRPEARLFALAWVLFPLVHLALGIISFQTLHRFAQGKPEEQQKSSQEKPGPTLPPERVAWLVERAGHYNLVKGTCLTQALVLSRLLARRGLPTTLRIGVARPQGSLTAHAWLEYQGRVIIGHQEQATYIPLQPGSGIQDTAMRIGT